MPDKKKTVYRDSKTGEFISQRQAERRPAESERERVRVRPPKRGR